MNIYAHIAQSVEHFLGKEEVTGSNPVMSSILRNLLVHDNGEYGRSDSYRDSLVVNDESGMHNLTPRGRKTV